VKVFIVTWYNSNNIAQLPNVTVFEFLKDAQNYVKSQKNTGYNRAYFNYQIEEHAVY